MRSVSCQFAKNLLSCHLIADNCGGRGGR